MEYGTKTAFVLAFCSGDTGPDQYRFYIDTDAEKIAFIEWCAANLQLFKSKDAFHGYLCQFPCGGGGLYFEQNEYEYVKAGGEEEDCMPGIIYPIRNDAEKLALFEQICNGELNTYVDEFDTLKKINVRVPTQVPISLPIDLAERFSRLCHLRRMA